MDSEVLKLLLPALGPTAGCVAIVWLFMRFLGNHMETNTQAMRDVAVALTRLATKIEDSGQSERET